MVKFRPLTKPIRLQDSFYLACSRAPQKIICTTEQTGACTRFVIQQCLDTVKTSEETLSINTSTNVLVANRHLCSLYLMIIIIATFHQQCVLSLQLKQTVPQNDRVQNAVLHRIWEDLSDINLINRNIYIGIFRHHLYSWMFIKFVAIMSCNF